MKFQNAIMILLLPLLLSGCVSKAFDCGKLVGQIDVYGIELFSDVDYREIKGVAATEEPCLRGYERNFDPLGIIIGYGFDKRIRKISTFNGATSLFGIRPGMTFAEGREKILQAGFSEYLPPFMYRVDGFTLKFLVGNDNTVFGLTLEALD